MSDDDNYNEFESEQNAVRETLLKEAVTLVLGTRLPPPLNDAWLSHQYAKVIADPASQAQSPRYRLDKEIKKYLQFPIIDGDDDLLEW